MHTTKKGGEDRPETVVLHQLEGKGHWMPHNAHTHTKHARDNEGGGKMGIGHRFLWGGVRRYPASTP